MFLQVLYAPLHYCDDHNLSLKVSWFSFLLLSLFLLVSCCSSVQFSSSVVSSSLQTHGLQHTRPPCPSPTPEFTQTHAHWVGDAIQPSLSLMGGGFPAGWWLPCWVEASLVAQLVKNSPAMQETWVGSLDWEDSLEKGKATYLSILPGEFHGLYSPRGHKESDMTEWLSLHFTYCQAPGFSPSGWSVSNA